MHDGGRKQNYGGGSLPMDMIVEILSRLPVKVLMRFKCVCKAWYDIILGNMSDAFVSEHLQNYYNNKTNDPGRLLLQYYGPSSRYVSTSLFSNPDLADFHHQPFEALYNKTYLLGPCNGVFYLGTYALWNPGIKECKMLPVPSLPPMKTKCSPDVVLHKETCGFGLDLNCGNFKVVIIREFKLLLRTAFEITSEYFSSKVAVYSANDGAWSYVNFPWRYSIFESCCYMFLNGTYYWIAFEEDDTAKQFLFSFDMSTNSFHRVISAPTFDDGSSFTTSGQSSLVLQGDSTGWAYVVHNMLHLWVMSSEGESVGWTKKVTFAYDHYYVFGCWKNGALILQAYNRTFLYYPEDSNENIKDLGINSFLCYPVLIYKESLVPIDGEKYIPGEIPLSWQERFQAISEDQQRMRWKNYRWEQQEIEL